MAITRAIEECVAEGILKDILEASKAEVLEMVLFEYNEELHIESEKKIAKEEGRQEGRQEGRDMLLAMQIQKKRDKGLSAEEIAGMLEITVDEVKKYE